MAYDLHGPWQATRPSTRPLKRTPGIPSIRERKPAASVVGTVQFFLSEGVAPGALVLGMPFYARQYVRVPDVDHGLYQSFDNTGFDESSWQLSEAPTYRDLVDVGRILEPGSGSTAATGQKWLHAILERGSEGAVAVQASGGWIGR